MAIPGNANLLLLTEAAGAAPTGYTIDRSVRFNSADTSSLTRSFSASNRKTWTWSAWVKRANLGTIQPFFSGGPNGTVDNDYFDARFDSSDTLQLYGYSTLYRQTNNVFRDASAWYHIVIAVDTTDGTANNRLRIYVNGVEASYAVQNNPNQNTDLGVNRASTHGLGYEVGFTRYFNGYLADIHFIDGQALDPTDFGEFDDNGVWQPIDASGLTYGTNGFHLKFDNTADLGEDAAGSNDWTVNNISVYEGIASVAEASGALPIYNTTDTYGTTKGTGTRTDSNSSSIVLAIPMDGTNGGTTFTDESANIKGSGSAKTLTVNGNTQTSTAQSKYYGSSAVFDGSGDYLSGSNADFAFGTGDFTVECWVRINAAATEYYFATTRATAGSSTAWTFGVYTDSKIFLYSNAFIANGATSLSAGVWHHVAVTRSGTTVRLFLNGVQDASGTNSQDFTTQALAVGASTDGAQGNMNGYIQDVRIYKGVAKYTSNFIPPSSTRNPVVAVGNDSLRDSPTNGDTANDTGAGGEVPGNYCTLNPLANSGATLSNGNLDVTTAVSTGSPVLGTFGMSAGKWYWEVTQTAYTTESTAQIGIVSINYVLSTSAAGSSSYAWVYEGYNGNKITGGSSTSYGSSYTTGDVIGVAFDADAGTIAFYKNGTSQGTAFTSLASTTYMPVLGDNSGSGSTSFAANFGQRAFAYSAPSGYKALCTANLDDPTIADGSDYFDTVLWTGNSTARTITTGFSPDFVWIKSRSVLAAGGLYDVVRGANKLLRPASTLGEDSSYSQLVTAFNSTSFSLGTDDWGGVNDNGVTYAGWCWDGGSSTVSNTDGSITSSVRANATAGFSIVTYTGNNTNSTVGHGLGVTPEMIIVKTRTTTDSWAVYHKSLGVSYSLFLNSTSAAVNEPQWWASTSPTSSVFSVGTPSGITNGNGANYVAYCFAPVEGYSAFGSYTGNGSSDGPFVYTGHRSRWLLIKASTVVDNWKIVDTERDSYNVAGTLLLPSASNSEIAKTGYEIDICSNGFKVRNAASAFNSNTQTYIWASFAENPFAYARAR